MAKDWTPGTPLQGGTSMTAAEGATKADAAGKYQTMEPKYDHSFDPPPAQEGGAWKDDPLKGGTDDFSTEDKPAGPMKKCLPPMTPQVPKPDTARTPKTPHHGSAQEHPPHHADAEEKPKPTRPVQPEKTPAPTKPETPKTAPVPPPPKLPAGVEVITPKDWQDEKCRMLANLQRHMRGGANIFTDPRHWLLDTAMPGYRAAGTFDSKYWLNGADQKQFAFAEGPMAGQVLHGHEVNYYFQGMIARAYNLSRADMDQRIAEWKKNRYNATPSPATTAMSRMGYDNYEKDLVECASRQK